MGEAKRKAASRTKITGVDFARIAAAVRALMQAGNPEPNGGCYLHASLARALCGDAGLENACLVVGETLWRVGDGDGDVIAHARGYGVGGERDAPYHSWVRIADHILDVTTYQLRSKAAALAAQDAMPLQVQWCPNFLLAPVAAGSSRDTVINGKAGLFHYREDALLAKLVRNDTRGYEEPEGLSLARVLYANPRIRVVGPAQIVGA